MTHLPYPDTPEFRRFMLTNRIYDDRIVPRLFRTNGRRKVKGAQADRAWLHAARIAARYEQLQEAAARVTEREQRQRDQVVVLAEAVQVAWLGAAVDVAYAPLLRCQQSHDEARSMALADVTRAARNEAIR